MNDNRLAKTAKNGKADITGPPGGLQNADAEVERQHRGGTSWIEEEEKGEEEAEEALEYTSRQLAINIVNSCWRARARGFLPASQWTHDAARIRSDPLIRYCQSVRTLPECGVSSGAHRGTPTSRERFSILSPGSACMLIRDVIASKVKWRSARR